MTPRPIIFSAPMVRALIDGRKTMTRRLAWKVADRQPDIIAGGSHARMSAIVRRSSPWQRVRPGDRLWTRETWKPHALYAHTKPRDIPPSTVFYRADDQYAPSNTKWVSPIHMPRWASRLTLVVTATKIERLQEISAKDCLAEGIPPITEQSFWNPPIPAEPNLPAIYRGAFACLWAEIHGPDSWDANPEVVALTFRVVRANIDSAEARTP